MAATIGCHLGLFVVLLRPAAPSTDAVYVSESSPEAISARFIAVARPRPMTPPPRPEPSAPIVSSRTPSGRAPPSTRHLPDASSQSSETAPASPAHLLILTLPKPAVRIAPIGTADPDADGQTFAGDGAFGERLLKARHGHDVQGVPGSDRRLAPGIQLIDPRDQGIGAVVRKAQRLFGIPDRHCIDVDAWQQLTTEELVARHISPADVKRDAEKYHCRQPLGLHF